MFEQKKSWRKILVPIICIVVVALGMGGWKIQSVDSYREEQEQIRREEEANGDTTTVVSNAAGDAAGMANASDASQKTKLANGGELVTPSVAQDLPGADAKVPGESAANEGDKMPGSAADAGDDRTSGKKSTTGGKAADASGGANGGTKSGKSNSPSADGKETGNGKDSGENVSSGGKTDSGKADGEGVDDGAYRPAKTPSPEKEPKEGMVRGTVTIDCRNLLNNMDALDANLQAYVPAGGYIVKGQSFRIQEGGNAYMALQAVCKELDIPLDASYTPLQNSYYVKGIGYLYEKNAGRKSGWLYSVNGKIPKLGISSLTVQEGDEISFIYTCNGGNDVN